MKIPYIKFIETLVIGRLKAEQIVNECANLGFQFPLDAVILVEDILRNKYPEYFKSTDPPDVVWIHDMGIEKMFGHRFQVQLPMGTSGISGAYRILNDPLMYRLITSMALANVNDEDIELIVNGKYNIEYATEDIVEFLHYFFNVKDWTLVEKQKFVDAVKSSDLKNAYRLALKGDKDYLLWKLGAAPEKPFDEMLKDMMVDSYYNFKERSKADPDMAQKWGALAVKITDRLEKLEKETTDRKDMFADIEFQIRDDETAPHEKQNSSTTVNVKIGTITSDIPHIENLQ